MEIVVVESRQHNTKVRLSLNKVTDKLDRLDEKVREIRQWFSSTVRERSNDLQ
jgi:hypothetical protein